MSFGHLYGAEWGRTTAKYWATSNRPWRRKRCMWCRRGRARGTGCVRLWHIPTNGPDMQVHHLTYIFGYGKPPLFVLRPMCSRCHHWETALTRLCFGEGFNRRSRWAHVWVTYGVRWLVNLTFLIAILAVIDRTGVLHVQWPF